MKKFQITTLLVMLLTFLSCNSVSKIANSDTAGNAIGVACGKTLSSLYSQYKTTKTVDLTNPTTLLQIAELTPYYTALMNNKSDAAYKQSFATGVVSGSSGLVLNEKSLSVVNSLLSMKDLSNFSTSTLASSLTAKNIGTGLENIFKMIK